jgi:hypothetical protein
MLDKSLCALLCLLPFRASPQDPAAVDEPPLAYPTLEPFVGSRMFSVLVQDVEQVDLEALAQQLAQISEINVHSKDAAERVAGKRAPPDRPSAKLSPQVPDNERALFALLPIVMLKLGPLWEAESWSAEQVKLAASGAAIVARITGAPALSFAEGRQAENRAALEVLVRWFHATAARPEACAAMIFTLDDGPYAGLPLPPGTASTPAGAQKLGEHVEVRLAKAEGLPEPFVVQTWRDGALVGERVVSAAPEGVVGEVAFLGEPKSLGTYGWKVHLKVKWTYGQEQGHLYVDRDGKLLFYYLSW